MVLQAVWEPSRKADRLYCQVSATSCERGGVASSILAKLHNENYFLFLFKCLVDLELTIFHFLT